MANRWNVLLISAVWLAAIGTYGCGRTPEQYYSQYLERGKKRLAKKDYSRAVREFRSAAQVMPQKGEPYYQLGLVDLAQSDLNRAVLNFQKATLLEPTHNKARLKLAELMLSSRKPEVLQQVERMAQKVLNADPGSTDALFVQAQAELKLGKTDAAVRSLELSVDQAPGNIHLAATLAAVRLVQKDTAGAEAAMKRLTGALANSADAWLASSHFYRLLNKTAEANAAVGKAVEVDPKHSVALFELAVIEWRAKQADKAGDSFQKLAALDDPRFRTRYAMYLFNVGRREESVGEFQSVVSKHPDDGDARAQLITAYLAVNKIDEAQNLIRTSLKRSSNDVQALELQARLFLATGQLEDAEQYVDRALAARTGSASAHYLKAKVRQARGDRHSYMQELGDALRLDPAFLEVRLEISQAFRAAGQPNLALRDLDTMPREQVGTLGAIIERNWVFFDLRKDAELKASLDRTLPVRRTPELLLQSALLSMRRKEYTAARGALDEILRQNPEDYRTVDTMLALFAAQNQIATSVEWIKHYAALRPSSAPMQYVMAQWLQATGDFPGARLAFARTETLDPKFKAAEFGLAKMDLADGKIDSARDRLTSLLKDNPRDLSARLLLGATEERAGNADTAIEHYRLILVADPDHVVALNNLASLLSVSPGGSGQALPYAEKAYKLAPDSAAVNDTLAWVYYQKAMYAPAVYYSEAAVKLQPTAKRKIHLALAYSGAGIDRLAEKTINEAIALEPASADAMRARAEIQASRKKTAVPNIAAREPILPRRPSFHSPSKSTAALFKSPFRQDTNRE